MDNSFDSDNP